MLNFLFTKTPLFFLIQSFWRDEAFTYLLSKHSIVDIIQLTAHDFSPPLYYILMHFWMMVAGHSEVAMRSVSLFFYMGTLYMAFLYMQAVWKVRTKKALLFLTLLAVNPLLLYFAFEARMYTMMAGAAMASYYFLARGKRKAYFWVTLAGMFTHYFMIFVPISQAAHLLLFEKDSRKKKRWLITIAYSFLLFAPWFAYVLMINSGSSGGFWIKDLPLWRYLPAVIITGFEQDHEFFKKYLLPISLGFYVLIAYVIWRWRTLSQSNRRELSLLGVWAFAAPVATLLVSYVKPLYLGRYLIASTVGSLLLLMFFIRILPRKIGIVIFLILFLMSIKYDMLLMTEKRKPDSRAVFKEIKKLSSTGDVVYVTSELNFHEAQYYFGEDRVFIYKKPYDEIPNYVGKILIPRQKDVIKLPVFPKKAFVVDQNLQYRIETMF